MQAGMMTGKWGKKQPRTSWHEDIAQRLDNLAPDNHCTLFKKLMFSKRKSVTFANQPHRDITTPITRKRRRTRTLPMERKVYEGFRSDQVTDEILVEASQLFTDNYGVWDTQAEEKMGAFAKPGMFESSSAFLNILTAPEALLFGSVKPSFAMTTYRRATHHMSE